MFTDRSSKKQGFTLIELLVVVAIIGMLASVVLASIGEARQSSQDAAIKQSVRNLSLQAEQYYNVASDYAALRRWWVGMTGSGVTADCATRNMTNGFGEYGDNFNALCETILANMPQEPNYYMYMGYRERVGTGPYVWQNDGYAFILRLNSGDWYCINSFGVIQEGPNFWQVASGCRDVTL